MKRKLWILLALAALSALIAGAALADGHRFVTQPQGGSIDPDTLSFTVSWETDFVPLRVEVMRIEYVEGTGKDFFGNTITVTREKPVRENTLTAGMARQMSYTTWAMKVDEPYRLFAYYGTGAEDYVSSEIYRPDDSALVFTTQPASGSYNPESLQFEAFWVTSFKPCRLEIMKCSEATRTERWGKLELEWTYTEKTRYLTVGTSLLTPAYAFPFTPEPYGDYCVRAYYTKDYYVDSEQFRPTSEDLKFLIQPASGSYDPETNHFSTSWKTSFTPLKTEVVRVTKETTYEQLPYGIRFPNTTYHYTVEQTLRNIPRHFAYTFDPAPHDSAHDFAEYQLRAYYTDDHYVLSNVFQADHSAFLFTAQPRDGELNHASGLASAGWTTSFSPVKVQILSVSVFEENNSVVKTWSAPPRTAVNYTFPAEAGPYRLRAFYGSGPEDYISSVMFSVNDPGYIFLRKPGNAVLNPTVTVWPVQWETNFTPTRVVITRDPYGENPVTVYDAAGGYYHDLPVGSLDSAVFRLTVYHTAPSAVYSDHISCDFGFTRSGFTVQPQSGTHREGGSCAVSWETNFAPVQMKLVKVTDAGETVTDTPVSGYTAGLQAGAGEDLTQYRLRAWWGSGAEDYVSSDPFRIFRLRFVTQPEGGRAPGVNEPFSASWQTSFVPVSFSFLALRDGAYQPVSSVYTVVPAQDGTATALLRPNQGGRLGTTYIVRAFAFDGNHVDSQPFDIVNPALSRVFFHPNGAPGVGITFQDVAYGETAVPPETPVSSVGEFNGWYLEEEALNPYDFSTPVDHAFVLYAGWDRNWTVTFESGVSGPDMNLSLPESQTVVNGRTAENPWPAGTMHGTSRFLRWTTDYEGLQTFDFSTPVTGNLTLYGQWHSTRCVVTFHANGHGYDRQVVVTEGETVAEPDDPSDTYYTHRGWFTDAACTVRYFFSRAVTGSLDLYASWVENPMMLCVYNDDAGTEDRYWFRWGTRFTPPAPVWTGHNFQGWYLDEALTVPFTGTETFLEDVTLYADWTVQRFRVDFDSCGGSAVPFQAVDYGARIVEPAKPQKDGFVFRGWYYNDTLTSECLFFIYDPETGLNNLSYWPVTETTTLYARWEPEGIRISAENFPDEALRTYVSGPQCDADENGYLSPDEREAVTEVSLSGLHVTDTTGIGCFSNLQKLVMQGNSADPDDRVTVLDLRGLDRLVELDVRGCGLTSLSLGYTPRVKKLYCQNNNLTSLNLAPYESLESVMAQDNPDLASLEVGPNIRTLYCYGTAVNTLDLLANPYLTYLAGLEGRITTYYVSGSTATRVVFSGRLNGVYCTMEVNDPRPDLITDGIPVDEAHFPDPGFRLSVSGVMDTNHNGWLTPDERAATRFPLRGGDIRSARGLAYFPALTELLIPLSKLEEIDVSGNPDLQRLNLYQNALTALDVSMLGALTNLDVGENPRLASLALGSAPLTRLNVAGCTDLAVLDLSGQPALLKARLTDSGTALPESGFSYTWTSDDGTLTATLLAEAEMEVLRPAWIWNSPEDVIFRLPGGREVQAEVTAEQDMHGTMMVCSAVAAVDGVPFTQNRILHRVRFAGADVPGQWVASGEPAAEPEPPVRFGSVFEGWYTAADGGEPVDFTAPVTAWRVFHAHWLTPGTENALRLPPQLTVIEAGAFTGTAADAVIIPSGVTQIAPDAFDDSNVRWIFGIPGSAAQTHADAHPSLTFVPVDKTWMTQH